MLNPKRCFGCSAVGHTKKECPVLNQPRRKIAKSKSGDVRKEGPSGRSTGGSGSAGRSSEVTDGPPKPPGIFDEDVNKGTAKPPKPEDSQGGKDHLDRMLQEATALMKSLRPIV